MKSGTSLPSARRSLLKRYRLIRIFMLNISLFWWLVLSMISPCKFVGWENQAWTIMGLRNSLRLIPMKSAEEGRWSNHQCQLPSVVNHCINIHCINMFLNNPSTSCLARTWSTTQYSLRDVSPAHSKNLISSFHRHALDYSRSRIYIINATSVIWHFDLSKVLERGNRRMVLPDVYSVLMLDACPSWNTLWIFQEGTYLKFLSWVVRLIYVKKTSTHVE